MICVRVNCTWSNVYCMTNSYWFKYYLSSFKILYLKFYFTQRIFQLLPEYAFVIRLWRVHRFKSSNKIFWIIIQVDGVGNSDIILIMSEGWLWTKLPIILIKTATPIVYPYLSWNFKLFLFFHLLKVTGRHGNVQL